MASNLALWWATLKANIAATTGLGSLDDAPINVEDWKATLLQPSTRLCAGHLGLKGGTESEDRHTSGGHKEAIDCTLTVATINYALTIAGLADLREALILTIEQDQTLGGYTDLVTYHGFEVQSQDGFGTVLVLNFTVTEYWEA